MPTQPLFELSPDLRVDPFLRRVVYWDRADVIHEVSGAKVGVPFVGDGFEQLFAGLAAQFEHVGYEVDGDSHGSPRRENVSDVAQRKLVNFAHICSQRGV